MTDDHYPIRRRGEKRRLDPNRKGAAWLEEQADHLTKIIDTYPLGGEGLGGVPVFEGLTTQGSADLLRRQGHPRRMFDVFRLGSSSGMPVLHRDPCPACLDFSRSWKCPEHGELAWNSETGHWGHDPTPVERVLELASDTVYSTQNPFAWPPRHQRQGLRRHPRSSPSTGSPCRGWHRSR